MSYFASLAVVVSLGLSLVLSNSFVSFSNFHKQAQSFRDWDEMALASSNNVARHSNTLLSKLKKSYKKSVETYNSEDGGINQTEINKRRDAVEEFLGQISLETDSELKTTIEFGLNHQAQMTNNPSVHPNLYKQYRAQLIHSDYLPVKLKDDDKVYRSTIISKQNKGTCINTNNLEQRIINNSQIRISRNLLVNMLGVEAADLIQSKADKFATFVAQDGLDLSSLPNGLEIDIDVELPKVQNQEERNQEGKTTTKRTIRKLASAQLRLSGEDIEVVRNNFVCTSNLIGLDARYPCLLEHYGVHNNCPCLISQRGFLAACPCREGDYANAAGCPCRPGIDQACTPCPPSDNSIRCKPCEENDTRPECTVNPPPPPPPPPTLSRSIFKMNIIPSHKFNGKERLGIYYDQDQEISASNPLRIVNRDRGGHFSMYQENHSGYLNISIGNVPYPENGLKQVKNKFKARSVDLLSGVNFALKDANDLLGSDSNKSGSSIVKNESISTESSQVNLDVYPRSPTRYGHLTKNITIMGQTITPRHIIIGYRKKDLTKVGRPKFNDFGSFRVYDPDTGAYLGSISNKKLKRQKGCKNAQCLDFNYTKKSQEVYNGVRNFQNFTSGEIFKVDQSPVTQGMSAAEKANFANELWFKIQADLASKTQVGINNGGTGDWTKKILKSLNNKDQVYFDDLFKRYLSAEADEEDVLYSLGFDEFIAHKDETATQLFTQKYDKLAAFAFAKFIKLNPKLFKRNTLTDSEYSQLKSKFEQSVNSYYNYVHKGIKPQTISTDAFKTLGAKVKYSLQNNSKEEEDNNTQDAKEDENKQNRLDNKDQDSQAKDPKPSIDCSKKKNKNKKACKGKKKKNNGKSGTRNNKPKNNKPKMIQKRTVDPRKRRTVRKKILTKKIAAKRKSQHQNFHHQ